MQERVDCGCGSNVLSAGMKAHLKTKRHKKWMRNTTSDQDGGSDDDIGDITSSLGDMHVGTGVPGANTTNPNNHSCQDLDIKFPFHQWRGSGEMTVSFPGDYKSYTYNAGTDCALFICVLSCNLT